jgi:UDP-N-acetylmuramoylalanine--D-glutamate ligase
VTTWIGEIARLAGLKVAVGGNLGTPVLDLLLESSSYDLWVLELSSFQLAALHQLNISVAVNLNVSPDHLDVHGSMENYIAAKQRIFAFAQKGVFNREDLATLPQYPLQEMVSFAVSKPKAVNEWGVIERDGESYIVYGQDEILSTNELKLQGQHHWLNAMATAAASKLLGIETSIIQKGLKQFQGLHHRTEWVAELDGITYINDSKGTNMGATFAAIQGIGSTTQGKIVLIAGGLSKGADMRPLQPLLKQYVKHVVLIGQDAHLLDKAWSQVVAISHANTLKQAIEKSKSLANRGDIVLLSPACASFDMFTGYEDRGQQFVNIVKEWMI